MADKTNALKGLTDKQIADAIRLILAQDKKPGATTASAPSRVADISVGDVIGEIVLHVIGAIPDIVVEVVTEGVPDVDVVADVIGDIVFDVGKEIVVHVLVDLVLDIIMTPLQVDKGDSAGLRGALEQRVERAKRVIAMASPDQAAPSSRELADLRKLMLKSRGRK